MDEHTRPPGERRGTETKEHLAETGRDLGEQAKREVADRTRDLRERGRDAAERQRSATAERLDDVARALRAAGDSGGRHEDWLGRGASGLAEQVERAARHLHDNDVGSLVHEVEDFARRRPEVFLGSALMAGILAGRFLRSSRDESPHRAGDGRLATRPVGQPPTPPPRPTGPVVTGPEGRS